MRWIIRAGIFFLSMSIIVMTALFAIPTDDITARVLSRISDSTGRDVTIRGAVRPRLFPVLGISAEDIEIGNPDWVEDGPMVAAQSLDVGVAWGPLLRGEVRLRSAELVGPRLILVRGEDGRVSWEMTEAIDAAEPAPLSATAEVSPSESSRIAFDEITIVDAALLFVDRAAGRTLQFDPLSARITATGEAGLVDLNVTLGQPSGDITLSTAIGSITALQAGQTTDLAVALDWPGGALNFDGTAATVPTLDGMLTLEARTLSPLFELAGLAAPLLPSGLGRDTLAVETDVTLSDTGSLHLRDTQARLDDNRIGVELDLLPGPARPLLRGNIDLGDFALQDRADSAADGGGETGQATAQPSGWSETRINAAGLFAVDTDLAVNADRLSLSGVTLEALTSRIQTDNGRAVVDLGYASVFGGDVTGQVVANARDTFSARANLVLTDLALNPAVAAFTGYERLEGTGSGSISVVAQGASMAALMRDLDGEGQLALGPGAIIGLDIAGMIRNFDAGFQGDGARTVYSGVTASFTIADGLLQNRDLAMQAPWGAIAGAGEVDIGARRLDYLVTPGLSARDDGSARVNVPVRIEGPWDDLSYRPDLEALANQELSEEIDALEDAATEAARDLVRDQLGVEIDEGASRDEAIDQIEQELGDRLQEEITDGLRSLFE